MKDKFNYTARIVYECPCCAHQWRDEKKDYCPNCEVRMQYADKPTLSHGELIGIVEDLKSMSNNYQVLNEQYVISKNVLDLFIEDVDKTITAICQLASEKHNNK